MNDLERFRLQTSFVIKSVTAEEFRRYAKTFRAHMQDTKGIENVEVRIGFGKHIEVSFDIKARSFSDANLRSGMGGRSSCAIRLSARPNGGMIWPIAPASTSPPLSRMSGMPSRTFSAWAIACRPRSTS